MEGILGVGFDLDGTLYANYKLYFRLIPYMFREWVFLNAFRNARRHFHTPGDFSSIFASGSFYDAQAALMAGILKEDPSRVKEKLEREVYRGWEEHFRHIRPFPHVAETLTAFRAAGLRLGLLSDFPPKRKLEFLGLASSFDAVFSTEELGALKPDSSPFKKLADAMGLRPEQVLYTGNSPGYDILGARKAGMKTALIRRGFLSSGAVFGAKNAGFVFRSYRQLREYVLR